MDTLFILHPQTQERVKVDLLLRPDCRAGAAPEPVFEICQISVWRNDDWQPCREGEAQAMEALLPEEIRLALHTRRWSDLPFYHLYPARQK